MLSFTSLLVLCLVLSAVVYVLYKFVVDSSKSVYRSKEPLALVDRQDHFKKPASKPAPVETAAAFGMGGEHSTPKNFARTHPAMPASSVDWRWQGSGVQLREPQTQPGKAPGNSGNCSLFDAGSQQTVTKPNPQTGIPHRNEGSKLAGRTHTVARNPRRAPSDSAGDSNKPWGW